MALRKHGRFYWLDAWIGKKRVRRSLKTGNYFEALDRAKRILAKCKECSREWELRKDIGGGIREIKPKSIN
jgi:hypothetical protein